MIKNTQSPIEFFIIIMSAASVFGQNCYLALLPSELIVQTIKYAFLPQLYCSKCKTHVLNSELTAYSAALRRSYAARLMESCGVIVGEIHGKRLYMRACRRCMLKHKLESEEVRQRKLRAHNERVANKPFYIKHQLNFYS